MNDDNETVAGVKAVLVQTLGIENRAESIDDATGLLGGIPELDSLAILELVSGLEERFGIQVDDEDFTGDIFETVGTLAAFIDTRRASVAG